MKYITLLLLALSITSCTQDSIVEDITVLELGTYERMDEGYVETWTFNADGTHTRYFPELDNQFDMTYTIEGSIITYYMWGDSMTDDYRYLNGHLTFVNMNMNFQKIE